MYIYIHKIAAAARAAPPPTRYANYSDLHDHASWRRQQAACVLMYQYLALLSSMCTFVPVSGFTLLLRCQLLPVFVEVALVGIPVCDSCSSSGVSICTFVLVTQVN